MPGFYPKEACSCCEVSEKNQFKIARFRRQYSWRNGKNGITIGSVAAVQIIDAVVADNNMRGVEMTGADGVVASLNTLTKLRGPWGVNKLIGVKFIGHPLSCPVCSHSWRPYFPQKENNPKSQGFGKFIECPNNVLINRFIVFNEVNLVDG